MTNHEDRQLVIATDTNANTIEAIDYCFGDKPTDPALTFQLDFCCAFTGTFTETYSAFCITFCVHIL
jgi:hypothetical protein